LLDRVNENSYIHTNQVHRCAMPKTGVHEEEAAKTDCTVMRPLPPLRQLGAAVAAVVEDDDVVEANDETAAELNPSAVSWVETIEMRRRLRLLKERTSLRVSTDWSALGSFNESSVKREAVRDDHVTNIPSTSAVCYSELCTNTFRFLLK